jgi:hypothetical protein
MARAVLVVMVAALLTAASAQADESPTPENVAAAPVEALTSESAGPSGGGTSAEPTPGPEAATSEAKGGQPEPKSETGAGSTPPPATETKSETTPPPASEAPPPPVATPPAEHPAPSPEPPTSESSSSESSSHAKSDEKSAVLLPALPDSVPPPAAAALAAAQGPEVAGATNTGTPTGSMVIDLGEAQVAGESSGSAPRTVAVKAPAGGTGGQSCGLQGLGGASGGGCVGAWLRVTGTLSPGQVSLSPVAAALAVTAVANGNSGNDGEPGSAGGGRSMPPAPGPAPGGASGVAAGGAGAGVGLSGFLAFVLLLALSAPRAMRRLKQACLPWRTAFFVLIPERPG